jgi:hypothetical protein
VSRAGCAPDEAGPDLVEPVALGWAGVHQVVQNQEPGKLVTAAGLLRRGALELAEAVRLARSRQAWAASARRASDRAC